MHKCNRSATENYIGILTLLAVCVLTTARSQTDTVIVYKRCPPIIHNDEFWIPHVSIDTMIVQDTTNLQELPRPIGGLSRIQQSVDYPELLLKVGGLDGRITVDVTIDENGAPINIHTLQSDHNLFDSAAYNAIRKVKFIPARRHGHTTITNIIIRISFSIFKRYEVVDTPTLNVSEMTLHHWSAGLVSNGSDYNIIFRNDSTAFYFGTSGVQLIGKYRGMLHPYYFKKLEALVGWFCLCDSIHENIVHPVPTDSEHDEITIVIDGQRKTLSTTGNDERVWGFARLIQQIASEITWQKVK